MIKKTYQIKAPIDEVWSALTEPSLILEWSGSPAVMDDKVGTNFSLWEGDIHGTNMEVVPQKKLVQNWFGGDWAAPSVVTFTLSQKGRVTTVELEHTGIPDSEEADFEAGWDDYYMQPINDLLDPQTIQAEDAGKVAIEDVYDDSILDSVHQAIDQQDQQSKQSGDQPGQNQ